MRTWCPRWLYRQIMLAMVQWAVLIKSLEAATMTEQEMVARLSSEIIPTAQELAQVYLLQRGPTGQPLVGRGGRGGRGAAGLAVGVQRAAKVQEQARCTRERSVEASELALAEALSEELAAVSDKVVWRRSQVVRERMVGRPLLLRSGWRLKHRMHKEQVILTLVSTIYCMF